MFGSSSNSYSNNSAYDSITSCNVPIPVAVGGTAAATYTPTSILQQHSMPNFAPPVSSSWGGVGGFATPPLPAPLLCAPPLTVASSLGNPQMPTTSMYSTSSPMGYNFRLSCTNIASAYKRKSDDDLDDRRPSAKQHITDDKVSASLDSLHLSSHYTSHTLGAAAHEGISETIIQEDCGEDSDSESSSASPRLYMSSDINKVTVDNKSALPDALLKNFKRDGPCMEVVLWQPRSQILQSLPPFASLYNNDSSSDDDTELLSIHNNRINTNTSVSSSIISGGSSRTITSNAFSKFYNSPSSPSVSSSDSGVSISPPSNSTASFETTCDMDDDTFSSSLRPRISANISDSTATHYPSTSSNPLILPESHSGNVAHHRFTPAAVAAPPCALNCATGSQAVLADCALNNNNNNCAVSAYTRSWVEENNNTGLRDLNTRHVTQQMLLYADLMPPLPDYEDMDL